MPSSKSSLRTSSGRNAKYKTARNDENSRRDDSKQNASKGDIEAWQSSSNVSEAKVKALQALHAQKTRALMKSIDQLRQEVKGLKQQGKESRRTALIQTLKNEKREQELIVDELKQKIIEDGKMTAAGVDEFIIKKTLGGPKRFRPKTREELSVEIRRLNVQLNKRSKEPVRKDVEEKTFSSRKRAQISEEKAESPRKNNNVEVEKVSDLLDEIDSLKIELAARERTAKQYVETIDNLRDETNSFQPVQDKLKRVSEKYARSKETIKKLQNTILEAKKKQGELDEHRENLINESKQLQERLNSKRQVEAEDELKRIETHNLLKSREKELLEEIDSLKRSLSEKQQEVFNAVRSQGDSLATTLEGETKARKLLEKQNKELKKEIADIQHQTEKYKEKEIGFREINEEHERVIRKMQKGFDQEMSTREQEFQGETKKLQEKTSLLSQKLETAESNNRVLETQLDEMKKELAVSRQKLEETTQKYEATAGDEAFAQSADEQSINNDDDKSSTDTDNDDDSINSDLTGEYKQSELGDEAIADTDSDSESDSETLHKELVKYKSLLSKKNGEFDILKVENQDLKKANENLEKDKLKLIKQNKDLQDTVEDLKDFQQKQNLIGNSKSANSCEVSGNGNENQLLSKIASLQSEISACELLVEKKNTKITSLETEILDLNSLLTGVRAKYEIKIKQQLQVTGEGSGSFSKRGDLNDSFSRIRTEVKKEIHQVWALEKQYQEKVTMLSNSLSMKENLIISLRILLEKLQAQAVVLQKQVTESGKIPVKCPGLTEVAQTILKFDSMGNEQPSDSSSDDSTSDDSSSSSDSSDDEDDEDDESVIYDSESKF